MQLSGNLWQRVILAICWGWSLGIGGGCLAQNSVTGAIRGQVLDRGGQPFPSLPVTLTNAETGERRSDNTDVDGYYEFPFLPPGTYKIVARGRPSYSYDPEIVVQVPLKEWQKVRLPAITFGRATLLIELTDAKGKLLPQARVRAFHPTSGKASDADEETKLLREGQYRFSFIGDGNYRIEVMIEGQWRLVVPLKVSFDADRRPFERVPYTGPIPGIQADAGIFFEAEVIHADVGIAVSLAAGDDSDDGAMSDAPTGGERASPAPPQRRLPNAARTQPPGSASAENSARLQLVNTFSAARSQDFTARQLQALPTGGRSAMRTYDELAFLVAGVAPAPYTFGPRGPGVGFGVNAAGGFAVNRQRARANNFTVDGSDNNDPDVGGRRQGFVALVPQSIESVNAFSISTLLWNAELGRNLGSQVNVVSRYGENAWHGQAYGFLTSSNLNARNFFDYSGDASAGKEAFTRTMQGFALGGPLKRDRLHFFGSLEQTGIFASTEEHFAVPTAKERRFKARNNADRFGWLQPSLSAPVNQALTTIQEGLPVGRQILSFYPLPNHQTGPFGENTWTQVLPNDSDGKVASFKVTYQIAPNHLFNARYNFTDDQSILPAIDRAIRSTTNAGADTQNASLIYEGQGIRGASLQTRFSYGRTRLGFSPYPDNPLLFSSSLSTLVTVGSQTKEVVGQTGQLGGVIIAPFSPVGVDVFNLPQSRANHTFQFSQALAWAKAGHDLRLGGEVLYYRFDSRQDRNYRPLAVYSGALIAQGGLRDNRDQTFSFVQDLGSQPKYLPGVELAALGVASSFFQTLTFGAPDSSLRLRSAQYSFFINDNWRVSPNFTLDYGLRYEYNHVPYEANRRIERGLQLADIPNSLSSSLNTEGRTRKFEQAIQAYRQIVAGRQRIYDADRNNFAPHLGFAWDLQGNGRTSLRAGYGLYYGVPLAAVISLSRNIFPNEIPVNIDPSFQLFDVFTLNNPATLNVTSNTPGNSVPLIATGTLNMLGGKPEDVVALLGQLFLQNQKGGGLAFTLPSKKLPASYSQQWHLSLERELFDQLLFSLAYVGTKGTKLPRLTTPNLGPNVTAFIPLATRLLPPSPPIAIPPLVVSVAQSQLSRGPRLPDSTKEKRPVPALGPYQLIENSASSIYHALQIEARRRFQRGYLFTLAYTYSHAIDDVSDIFPLGGASNLPQNSRKLRLERASANFDLRHRVAASWVWELPFYRGQQTARARWLGGWQMAALWQAQTGPPFTLNVPFDANQDGNLTDRPKTTNGLEVRRKHGRQMVLLNSGVNPEQFFDICPTGCSDGAVGRNTIRGDGFASLDVALEKQFRFSDRRHLVWRTEVFNLFNRANFGLPLRTIGSPGFGAAVETVSPARLIQFALRFSF